MMNVFNKGTLRKSHSYSEVQLVRNDLHWLEIALVLMYAPPDPYFEMRKCAIFAVMALERAQEAAGERSPVSQVCQR